MSTFVGGWRSAVYNSTKLLVFLLWILSYTWRIFLFWWKLNPFLLLNPFIIHCYYYLCHWISKDSNSAVFEPSNHCAWPSKEIRDTRKTQREPSSSTARVECRNAHSYTLSMRIQLNALHRRWGFVDGLLGGALNFAGMVSYSWHCENMQNFHSHWVLMVKTHFGRSWSLFVLTNEQKCFFQGPFFSAWRLRCDQFQLHFNLRASSAPSRMFSHHHHQTATE